MQVASPNSPCAARGRGKRPPENPKNRENPCFWSFLGALFHLDLYRVSIIMGESKTFIGFFFMKKKSFRKKSFVFIFLLYLEINSWKFQCATPTIRAKCNHIPIFRDFYRSLVTLLIKVLCSYLSTTLLKTCLYTELTKFHNFHKKGAER